MAPKLSKTSAKPIRTRGNSYHRFLVAFIQVFDRNRYFNDYVEQMVKDHIVYLNFYKSVRVYKKKISQLLNRAEQIEEKNSGESSRLCEGLKISVISGEQSWIDEVGDRVSGVQR